MRHLSHLHEEFPDPVLPELVDAHNGCIAFSLGAEKGVFQGEIGLPEQLDLGPDKDDVVAEKKVKSATHNTPNDGLLQFAFHRLPEILC